MIGGARARESERDGKQNSNSRPRAPDVVPGIGQKVQHGKRGREREKEKRDKEKKEKRRKRKEREERERREEKEKGRETREKEKKKRKRRKRKRKKEKEREKEKELACQKPLPDGISRDCGKREKSCLDL